MVSQDASSSSQNASNVFMRQKDISVATRNKDYGNLNPSIGKATDQPCSSTPSTPGPLQISKLAHELTIKPQVVIHKSSFNPHVRAT